MIMENNSGVRGWEKERGISEAWLYKVAEVERYILIERTNLPC